MAREERATDHRTPARATPRPARPFAVAVTTLTLAAGLFGLSAAPASASGSGASSSRPTSGVFGEVLARATGAPVAGATVTLPASGVSTETDRHGDFRFPQPVTTAQPYRRIEAVVRAAGFGTWTITGAPLYPDDPLHLHAELSSAPFTHRVLTPQERARAGDPTSRAGKGYYVNTCTGWTSNIVPPRSISVYSTTQHTSATYDFVFYLTHVLPDEWIASWDADSLGAGAIAAKTYAWFRTLAGHAYTGGTGCADITDYTGDQVFDPTWSNANTDQAVYATYGTINQKNGGIWLSQYWSGTSTDPCAEVTTGQFAGRMDQWATQACAKSGLVWPDIVKTFYPDTSWLYEHNLLLDASAEDAQTYGWLTTGGTGGYTRVSGGAYKGGWYLQNTRSTTLYQVRPFDGVDTTTYTFTLALRCPTSTSKPCNPTLKVIANGATVAIMQTSLLSVPRDGAWHVYSLHPPQADVAHSTVQVNVILRQVMGVDSATLSSAFGGP